MTTKLDALNTHLKEIHNLTMAYWLLDWDQNTHMPPEGGDARAKQKATIQRLRHELLVSDKAATLIEEAKEEVDMNDFDSFGASLVRVAQRDYDYDSKLSAEFVERYAQATAQGFEVWRKAKAANDYAMFVPALQRIIDLRLEEAEFRGYTDHVYDVFLGHWERGLTTSRVQAIFGEQKPHLVELLRAVNANQDRVDDSVLHQPFAIDKQRELSRFASTAFGFDYDAWARMDVAPHPFCLQLSIDDVRLTTRFDANFFNPAFFATLHETGHGLHGRGFAAELDGTFLSNMEGGSQAVAESQSRTWENLVGRSREYWEWVFPKVRETFPEQMANATPESMYKAVNKARSQFIRVEADELTYNLHIMLRTELEIDLVASDIAIESVPDFWADKFKEYFGITPANHVEGVLQDIHWSLGGIGAFVGYALGNLLSVQYYNQALKAHPNIPNEITQGKFDTLRTWLTDNIYTHGRKFNADELTRKVTGEGMQSHDHTAYLQNKSRDIYGL